MNRFDSFSTLIRTGGYKLTDIRERICGIADRGEITLEQRDRLLALANEHADPLEEADKGGMLADHERRIRALEAKIEALTGESGGEDASEYQKGKWYYAGDKVTFGGAVYVCIAPKGAACVWSPEEYPAYWTEMG